MVKTKIIHEDDTPSNNQSNDWYRYVKCQDNVGDFSDQSNSFENEKIQLDGSQKKQNPLD